METTTRGHKKRARTRRELVAAALDVIGERGEAFSIGEVAERAGVSNGTFYNYFDDRDDLLAAIVPEAVTTLAIDGARAVQDDDPAARFAGITALVLAQVLTEPERWRVVIRLDAARSAVLDGEPLRHLRADLDAGRASGRFAVGDTDAVIDVVVGTMLAAARRLLAGSAGPRHGAEVVELLLRSLGIDGAEAGRLAADAHDRAQAEVAAP